MQQQGGTAISLPFDEERQDYSNQKRSSAMVLRTLEQGCKRRHSEISSLECYVKEREQEMILCTPPRSSLRYRSYSENDYYTSTSSSTMSPLSVSSGLWMDDDVDNADDADDPAAAAVDAVADCEEIQNDVVLSLVGEEEANSVMTGRKFTARRSRGLIFRFFLFTVVGAGCLVATSTPAPPRTETLAPKETSIPISLAREVSFPTDTKLKVQLVHNTEKQFIPKSLYNSGAPTTTNIATTTTASTSSSSSQLSSSTTTTTTNAAVAIAGIPRIKRTKSRPELLYAHKIESPKFVRATPDKRFVPTKHSTAAPEAAATPMDKLEDSKSWVWVLLLILAMETIYKEFCHRRRGRRTRRGSSIRSL